MEPGPTVLVTAIEASADRLGAGLVRALRERLPQARFVGVGGPAMAAAGVTSPFDPSSIAVVGVFNAVGAYPRVRRRVRETVELAAREKPDLAILIDAWGYSLRVAHGLRRLDPSMRLIKYVGPQIWATRPGRARTLATAVDHLLTIHAFDGPMFEAAGLSTSFVGSPALAGMSPPPEALREARTLLILPGSRLGEVKRLLPVFGRAAALLQARLPDLKVQVGVAEGVADLVRAGVSRWAVAPELVEGDDRRAAAMRRATAALACSGTVTTELAMAGCPMVVGYRLDPMTYQVAKRLIRTPWITLVNIAAQREVTPEFVQAGCTPDALAGALTRLLNDPVSARSQAAEQSAALEIMRGGIDNPAEAAAEAVIRLLAEPQPRVSTGT